MLFLQEAFHLKVLFVKKIKPLGTDDKDLFKKISRGQYEIPSTLSPEVSKLIKKMLRMNPHERPSAEEVNMIRIH